MSETTQVKYEVDMRDGLSSKIDAAGEHVNKFEKNLSQLKERALATLESIGFGFAIFKGFEFVKESKEDWEQLEFANSQLEAGLESTKQAAGLTFKELQEGALGFSHNLKFTQADVERMQSILLTFPAVTKDTFNSASKAILDMSTRLGTDAKDSAIQLGKALQDPISGLNALHRVGVNVDELRKKFVHVTDTLQRQKLIIAELNSEFGGSAEAAAKADVSFRYEKAMNELSVTIGEIVDRVSGYLAPAFEAFANSIKNSVEWLKRNNEIVSSIATGIGVMVGAWLIYRGVLLTLIAIEKLKAFWDIVQIASMYTTAGAAGGLSTVMTILTAVQYGLNAAITANPIGILIVAIGAAVAAVIYCYKHFETFHAVLWGVWATIKAFGSLVSDVFMGLYHAIHGAITFDGKEIESGMMQQFNAVRNAGQRLGGAFQTGFNAGIADFKLGQKEDSLLPTGAPKAKALGQGRQIKDPNTKATSNKVNTFYITIKDVVGVSNINVTNIKEGSNQARQIVTDALASAVNDVQVVADH